MTSKNKTGFPFRALTGGKAGLIKPCQYYNQFPLKIQAFKSAFAGWYKAAVTLAACNQLITPRLATWLLKGVRHD